jgi:hypothetical protein
MEFPRHAKGSQDMRWAMSGLSKTEVVVEVQVKARPPRVTDPCSPGPRILAGRPHALARPTKNFLCLPEKSSSSR